MIEESWVFKAKSFSWDSGQYEEYLEDVSFKTENELNAFCIEFSNIPVAESPIQFGEHKAMDSFGKLLYKFGMSPCMTTGGVSSRFEKLYRKIIEYTI